jgi:glutamate synthase (NADPH/NADH) small chain
MMSKNESVVVKKKKEVKKRRKERIEPHFLPVELRSGNFREVNLGYISYDEFLAEADRCIQCGKPKCVEGCPVNFNVKELIGAIKEDNIEKALELLYGTYCFPQSIDRVCPKFCEQNCVLGKKGDPVQIMYLKRYLADNFARPDSYFNKEKATNKNIAIIGSGPAGLTAGYYLAKLGHNIVIFEKSRIYGGMLTLGIPEYRLPRDVINEEIRSLKKFGINFANNFTYGKDFDHKSLFQAGYDAILIAHGAHKPKWMGLEGEKTLEGSLHVVDFLRDYELDRKKALIVKGKKVAVIGGGDSAIDAARVSKRLGADSMIIYRRSREEMPAEKIEIEETDAEGIPINILTNPIEILHDGKKVTGLKLIKMELGEPDDSGRRRPVPIKGSEYTIDVDIIIQAISQEPDTDGFTEEYALSRWKTFEVNEETMETNVPGLFAAGDNVTGPSTVVNAVAHAHKAVKSIHEYVMNK